MTWITLDFLRHEATFFANDLNDLVVKIYEGAFQVLTQVHANHMKEYEEFYAKASGDENAQEEIWQGRDAEDHKFLEQTESLGAMTLAILASLIEGLLDKAKGYLKNTHPAKPNGYPGKSKLQRRVAEYEDRFGIRLNDLPGFDAVIEVVLGRNCCLHKDGEPDDDYKSQTKQTLLDQAGKVSVSLNQLHKIVADLKQFPTVLLQHSVRSETIPHPAQPPDFRCALVAKSGFEQTGFTDPGRWATYALEKALNGGCRENSTVCHCRGDDGRERGRPEHSETGRRGGPPEGM